MVDIVLITHVTYIINMPISKRLAFAFYTIINKCFMLKILNCRNDQIRTFYDQFINCVTHMMMTKHNACDMDIVHITHISSISRNVAVKSWTGAVFHAIFNKYVHQYSKKLFVTEKSQFWTFYVQLWNTPYEDTCVTTIFI